MGSSSVSSSSSRIISAIAVEVQYSNVSFAPQLLFGAELVEALVLHEVGEQRQQRPPFNLVQAHLQPRQKKGGGGGRREGRAGQGRGGDIGGGGGGGRKERADEGEREKRGRERREEGQGRTRRSGEGGKS